MLIESTSRRWASPVARKEEDRNGFRIVTGRPKPLGRSRHRYQYEELGLFDS